MIGYTTRSLSSSVAGAVGGAVVGFAVKKLTEPSKEEKKQIRKLLEGKIIYDCLWKHADELKTNKESPKNRDIYYQNIYDILYYREYLKCMPNINPNDKKLPEKYFACRKKAEKQADKMFKKLKKIADKYFEKWAKKYSS